MIFKEGVQSLEGTWSEGGIICGLMGAGQCFKHRQTFISLKEGSLNCKSTLNDYSKVLMITLKVFTSLIVVVQCKPPRRDQPLYKDQRPCPHCGLSSEVSLYHVAVMSTYFTFCELLGLQACTNFRSMASKPSNHK